MVGGTTEKREIENGVPVEYHEITVQKIKGKSLNCFLKYQPDFIVGFCGFFVKLANT